MNPLGANAKLAPVQRIAVPIPAMRISCSNAHAGSEA